MVTLSQFSEFQEDGNLASCEIDGKVRYSIPSEVDSAPARLIPFVRWLFDGINLMHYSFVHISIVFKVAELPNIDLHDGAMSNITAKYTAASPKELFLKVEDTKWSKIKTAW